MARPLRDLIAESGLTHMQLATRARISLSTLQRVLAGRGKHGAERKTKEDIAAALGLGEHDIIWPAPALIDQPD